MNTICWRDLREQLKKHGGQTFSIKHHQQTDDRLWSKQELVITYQDTLQLNAQMMNLLHQDAKHGTIEHVDASNGEWSLQSSNSGGRRLPLMLASRFRRVVMNGCGSRRRQELFIDRGGTRSKGRPNRCKNDVGRPAWAGRPRPFLAQFGPVFLLTAHLDILDLCPLHLCHISIVISAIKIGGLLEWSPIFTSWSSGMFRRSTLVLVTFGSDLNTNGTPHLLLWTWFDSVLLVHVFLQKHYTSKCTYKIELVIWLMCLVAG
jgi:hypothetical protein